jgi:hypothetical protein
MLDYKFCQRAGVAQLVEQLICNQRVGGSSPFASSNDMLSRLSSAQHCLERWPSG